jgi:predicted CoA-binding protein
MTQPKTVAVIGASQDRSKYSNKAVRAYLRKGWTVYPVNPRGGEIEGLPVYRSIGEVPGPIDRVTLYLPPEAGLKSLAGIAAARPGEFFVNPGAESEALVAEARRLGLSPILACSIIEIGATPGEFPDRPG